MFMQKTAVLCSAMCGHCEGKLCSNIHVDEENADTENLKCFFICIKGTNFIVRKYI